MKLTISLQQRSRRCYCRIDLIYGARSCLSVLPLNLTGENGGPGRAWLLPLLRDNVRFAGGFYKILFYKY